MLFLILLIPLFCYYVAEWTYQNNRWNNGICKITETPWVFVTYYGVTTRIYRSGDQNMYVSLPLIDHNYQHPSEIKKK